MTKSNGYKDKRCCIEETERLSAALSEAEGFSKISKMIFTKI